MNIALNKRYGSLFRTLLAAFVFACICIAFFLTVTYQNMQFALTESRDLKLALVGMKHLEILLDDMQDLETGERGYTITKDALFLEPYNKAIPDIYLRLDSLYEKAGYNKSDLLLLNHLDSLINIKIIISESLIQSINSGGNNHSILLQKNYEGRKIMDEIRSIILTLENHGRLILNNNHNLQSEKAVQTTRLFLITSVCVLIVLTISFLSIYRILQKRLITEKELEETSKTLNDLYNHAPNGYHSVDEHGTIITINDTELKMLGYSREEVEGKMKVSGILTFESFLDFQNHFEEFKKSGKLLDQEFMLRRKDNTTFPALVNATALFDEKGRFIMSRSVLIDITERKSAEEKISYLAELIDKSSEAIISIDTQRKIRSWNYGAEKVYGYSREEVLGKNIVDLLKVNMTEEELQKTRDFIYASGSLKNEVRVETKAGKQIWVTSSKSRMLDKNGVPEGIFIMQQNITERKNLEEQLKLFNKNLEEEVKRKTNEISSIFERVSDAFIALDKNWNYTYVNDRAALIANQTRKEMIGKNIRDVLPADILKVFMPSFEKAMNSNLPVQEELYNPSTKKWILQQVYPSENGISVFFRDITLRKEQEEILSASERKYRLMFESSPLPMWVYDIETFRFIDVNEAAVKHYGYSKEEFLNMSIFDIRSTDEHSKLSKYLDKNYLDISNSGSWKHKLKNGSEIDVLIYGHEISIENKKGRLILIDDVTDKLKAEKEAKAAHDKMRQLNNYLNKIREEERTTIAREIHDELGQQLTGLKMDVSWLRNKLTGNEPNVTERVHGILGLIDDIVTTIRKIATQLRPGILDDLGLIAALEWQCSEFEKRNGIKCKFTCQANEELLPNEFKTVFFRVFQESLTNVARHSEATEVNAELKKENDCLVLIIEDNGKGFNESENKKHTLGLLGMQERARMIGGELTIHSKPGEGSSIELRVKIKKPEPIGMSGEVFN